MGASHAAVEQADRCVVCRRFDPVEEFRAPCALLRAAEPHEECRRVFRTPKLRDDVAMSDKSVESRDIREREQDLSFGKAYGVVPEPDVQCLRDALEILAAALSQPYLPPDALCRLLWEQSRLVREQRTGRGQPNHFETGYKRLVLGRPPAVSVVR